MNTRAHPALPFFVGALALVAALGFAASWVLYPVPLNPAVFVFLALAIVGEVATFADLRGGDVATSYPVTVAALVLFGPTTAALIGLVVALATDIWQQRGATIKVVYNVSQTATVDLAAGWVYVLVGGPVLAHGQPLAAVSLEHFQAWTAFVWPVLASAVVGVIANALLMASVMWLSQGTPPISLIRDLGVPIYTLVHVSLAVVGVAVALVVVAYNWLGLVVFAFPLITARQIFQNFARLQHDYPDTVRILVNAIEAKDQYTKGHSERVAQYAVRFAHYLGLDDREIEQIEFAALLHDLGKMGVRAEVLKKPARLTALEYDEMKGHPTAAIEIVEAIPDTERLVPVIRHHHERMDGQGYPDGMVGEAIPFGSRLLAVCDTYDAMTSSRPYRPALSQDAAVAELHAAAGGQLDAKLAAQFIGMLANDGGPAGALQ